MNKPSLVSTMIVVTATIAILVAQYALTVNQSSHIALAQHNSTSSIPLSNSSLVKVQAGTGNSTLPYDVFYPKQVQITAGQSVSWYNGAKVGVPHTVTFVTDNKTKASLSTPFAVKNSSSFMAVPPGSNSQPVIIPNRQYPSMTVIQGSNARASSPVIIDSTAKVIPLGSSPAYSVKGDEKYVNSGLIFPKGKGPPNGGTSFTLTFEKTGTYNYYCIIHPWMKGKVIVK
ncbi:MAG TPA: plastocyanin/azurin family copper-binding protein [Candidatus Nitrosopolaris sp.]|nr:plastocyanin/azurin family copper-binding protein [Candidatus Nitrosopolaris sp.]